MSSPAIRIHVSTHAVWRAYDRFPGFDPLDIEPEIREAFRSGRVSPRKPAGVLNDDDPGCLYAWTADGHRVYVLTVHANGMSIAVKTAIKTTLAPDWAKDERLVIERLPPSSPDAWGRR